MDESSVSTASPEVIHWLTEGSLLPVRHDQLSPAQRAELIAAVIEKAKPAIHHCHGFRELQQVLSDRDYQMPNDWGQYTHVFAFGGRITLSPTLKRATHVLGICSIYYGQWDKRTYKRYIFVTRQGELVLVDRLFEVAEKHGDGSPKVMKVLGHTCTAIEDRAILAAELEQDDWLLVRFLEQLSNGLSMSSAIINSRAKTLRLGTEAVSSVFERFMKPQDYRRS